MAEQKTDQDPTGVLDQVREFYAAADYAMSVLTEGMMARRAAYERFAGLNLMPLVEALESIRKGGRKALPGFTAAKALAELQEQLEEKASA